MTAGHCCLYKNKPEINAWYKTMPANGFQNWKDVFTTNEVRAFDEWGIHCGGGISYILESNGIKSYSKRIYADVSFEKGRFFINGLEILQKYKQGYFVYENGHIYFCDKDKKLAEFMYVHFQKRAFKIDGDIKEPVYFIAPGFITSNKNEICKKRFFDKIRFETTYWLKRIKRKLYHILIK